MFSTMISICLGMIAILKAFCLSVIHFFIPPALKSVKGEIVLITGSGSGIGRVMAKSFARLGAKVVLWDVNTVGNKQTKEEIENDGYEAYLYTVDVSDKDAVFDTAKDVAREIGDVDILINNAGVVSGAQFMDITDEQIQRTIDVNLMAHFWTVKSFLPSMKERNHGHIVTIASIAGLVGCNNLVDYCASKFANVGFSDSLTLELQGEGKTGINTTLVCPYYIHTGMFAGCKTRYPWMMKHLMPGEAVAHIMKAVLTNQKMLVIPKSGYIVSFLKSVLPLDCSILLHKFLGASSFMDGFVGHHREYIRDTEEDDS